MRATVITKTGIKIMKFSGGLWIQLEVISGSCFPYFMKPRYYWDVTFAEEGSMFFMTCINYTFFLFWKNQCQVFKLVQWFITCTYESCVPCTASTTLSFSNCQKTSPAYKWWNIPVNCNIIIMVKQLELPLELINTKCNMVKWSLANIQENLF